MDRNRRSRLAIREEVVAASDPHYLEPLPDEQINELASGYPGSLGIGQRGQLNIELAER